jgi:disulfide bond formation protein DsbB
LASNRFDTIVIRLLNVAARVVGVFTFVAGVGFLLSAWFGPNNRVGYLVVAALCIAIGMGIWVALPITQSQIDSIRAGWRSD